MTCTVLYRSLFGIRRRPPLLLFLPVGTIHPRDMAKIHIGIAVALMLCCGAMSAAIHEDVANLQGCAAQTTTFHHHVFSRFGRQKQRMR